MKHHINRRQAVCGLFVIYSLFLSSGCVSTRSGAGIDAGLFYNRGTAVDGTDRTRAAGPFFEKLRDSNEREFKAVRPLYCRIDDSANERTMWEVLWPLATGRSLREQSHWRVLTAQRTDFDVNDPDGRYRFTIMPLWISGKSAEGESYAGLFPIYGDIREFLWQDEIKFVLFPVYAEHRRKETRSYHVLWPVISWTRGPGVWRRRIFPLYGESRREGEWERRFILWPVWTSLRIPGDEDQGGFVLFPLFGYMALPDRQAWMLFPPFVRWSRAEDGFSAAMPWPFVRIDREPDLRRTDIWPLWGRRREAGIVRGFVLWPLGHWYEVQRSNEKLRSSTFLPLWYRRTLVAGDGDEAQRLESTWKIWPLVSWRSRGEDSRLRLLELWPGADIGPVERNYAACWSVYTRTQSAEAREHDLLWGLFRSSRESGRIARWSLFPLVRYESADEDERYWSLLGGLVSRRQQGLHSRWRLLYVIPLGSNAEGQQ